MSPVGSPHPAQPQEPETGRPNPITLEPLRALGLDALDTQGIPPLQKITLREIEVVADNAFHQLTVWRADDLFDCAAADGPFYQPIPETGTITRAVLDIEFSDTSLPVTVEICLPDIVTLPLGRAVPALECWLTRCGIRIPQKLARILTIIALIFTGAASPVIDDDTDDDDDGNRRHSRITHLSRRSQTKADHISRCNHVTM